MTHDVTLAIPKEAMTMLERASLRHDMSVTALMKTYIGQGLRKDNTKIFNERLWEATAEVLARHISSEEERAKILREIQGEIQG